MGRESEQAGAVGERSVGAGGDVKAAATGDHSTATYTHIENQYVRSTLPEQRTPSPEESEEALRRYATRVRECYGRLDLEVLIPTEEGEHPAVGLTEVFVPPLVRADPPPVELPRDVLNRLVAEGEWPSDPLPGPERVLLEQAQRAYLERPLRDVLEVLEDPAADRLVLLGDPGAGKSTLARHVALEPPAGRVPLVVELREYAAGEWRERTFEDFLEHLHTTKGMAPPRAVVGELLASGRAVVFFDGLDELFDPAVREQVSHRIADFAGRYRGTGVRVVVTSRVIGYKRGVLDGAGFAHFMIHDLNEQQIGTFARRWYETAFPHDEERAGRLCRRLKDAVSGSRPVRELAGNPLLLTILAIIGRRRELPRDRIGVYRHAVAVLVAHWDEHAKYLKGEQDTDILDEEDRRELLRLVARQMQDGEGGIAGNHVHRDELIAVFRAYLRENFELPPKEAVVLARRMVECFRERNFILSHYGGGVYGFVHRAFLEYLAAEDIERRYTREREWTRDELVEEVFARRAEDPAWNEALLLLAGQLGEREAGAAIDRILELHRGRREPRDPRFLSLGVQALAEVRKVGALAAQSRAVVTELIAFLEEDGGFLGRHADLQDIASALASFGPHWSGRGLFLRWFHLRGRAHVVEWGSADVGCALYTAPELPKVFGAYTRGRIGVAVMKLLAARWGTEAGTWEFIREQAAVGRDEDMQVTALQLLADQSSDDDSVWSLVHECAGSPSAAVEACAYSLRARHMQTRPETRGVITEDAICARNPAVRQAALELLGALRSEEDGTRSFLLQRAVADPEAEVRWTALDVLCRTWPAEPDTTAFLRARAVEDRDWSVRHLALRQWSDRAGTERQAWEFLRARVYEDEEFLVCQSALEALGRFWGDDPRTGELMRDCAANHREDNLRVSALHQLERLAGGDTATRELLVRLAIHDPAWNVRGVAWRVLGQCGDVKQRVMGLIADRAVADPDDHTRALAMETLARVVGHETEMRELLRRRAAVDTSGHVRRTALQLLKRHAGNETQTWDLMRRSAVTDDEWSVRSTAIGLLAANRGHETETRELLRSRAEEDPRFWGRSEALRWWAVHEPGEEGARFVRARVIEGAEPADRGEAARLLALGWPAHPETLPFLREHGDADAVALAEALAPIADQMT